MSTFQLMLGEGLSPGELRFAVELSHLIGFASISLEFPFVLRAGETVDPEAVCFYLGSTPPPGKNVVPVTPGLQAEELWLALYRQYVPGSARAALRPRNFVSATENAMAEGDAPLDGGLELLFEKGWLLLDQDRDGLPDKVDCRFLFAGALDESLCCAACSLAARLGMESTCVRYPLVAEVDDGTSHLIMFRGGDVPPAVVLEEDAPRKIIAVEGGGQVLEQFASTFAQTFPLAQDNLHLCDVVRHMQDALSLKNADGQAAWLEIQGGKRALLSMDADLGQFRQRWPDTEFHRYSDDYPREERTYPLPWEMETARSLLEQVLAGIRPGDQVSLRGALGQDRPEREELAHWFQQEVIRRGGQVSGAALVCTFKPGLSWLEEDFAPRAAQAGGTRRIIVRFYPHPRTAITYNADAFDWAEIDQSVSKPPRWLQDLYPVDELMADIVGISKDDVFFEAYPSDPAATYEALAFDSEGRCILRDTWTVRTCARPYLEALPQLGPALVSTGFLQILVNGESVLDSRVTTDYEQIWDVFQTELIPWLKETAENRGAYAHRQPFFSRLELEVGLGGPDRQLETRNDHISIGEVMEDSLHQVGHAFFMHWGRMVLGERLDAPGLVLPRIHIRPGRPTLRAVLHMPYGEAPSFPAGEGRCRCTRISTEEGRLALEMACEAAPDRAPAIPALALLTGQGFTSLGHMLTGYGSLTLASRDGQWRIPLPERENTPQALDIRQIDLMPDRLIGYDDYRRIMLQLRQVPGLHVYPAGRSRQGRVIYALEPAQPRRGYVSRVKRIQYNPTVLINGRHHANEVSATNAIFSFVRELLTDPRCRNLPEELNLIILPMENVDGAALHYEMQKDHPHWQHRTCYTNSLGADLMPNYFRPDTIHTEANVFTRLSETMLPDAFIDLHGVPHHELPQQFDQLAGYKGLWLPRTPLCAFYYHIDDPRFASNRELSLAWKQCVDGQYEGWTEFEQLSELYNERFLKYSWGGIDESYPCKHSGPMLDYWIPSPYNSRHPYPTVSLPWTFSVMFTAEAADETAHGPWLAFCAQAHLAHVRAGVELMRRTRAVMEETALAADGAAQIKYMRHRPALPPGQ